MIEEIRTPEFTDRMGEAVLSSLYVAVGDYVEEAEVLFDIETDKVALEVTAPLSGYIKAVHYSTGQSLRSNVLVAVIEEGEAPIEVPEQAAENSPQMVESEVGGSHNLKYAAVLIGLILVGALIISIG